MNKQYGTWSKLVTSCLAVFLALGLPAFTGLAMGTNISESTGAITVVGVEEGTAVSAYRILNVNFDFDSQQPVDPMYVWNAGTADWVKNTYGSYIDLSDNSVQEAYTQADAAALSEFYGRLAAAVKNDSIALDAVGTCTGDGTISGLEMGGYLILIEDGMQVYQPSVVNIIPEFSEETGWTMSTSILQVKSSTPEITKTADKISVAIGNLVGYDLRSNVPQYPADAAATQYVISDTLSAGLTLKVGTLKVYGVDSSNAETPLAAGTAYTQGDARPNGGETTTFSLSFIYEKIKQYKEIHVTYQAAVNEQAVVGETGIGNKAVLDYNNNPYNATSWKEKTSETAVYTYGIKISKINKKNEALSGAEFTLSKDSNGTNALYFVKTDDGAYRLASSSEEGASQKIVVNNQGKLTVSGLAAEDVSLYLTETKAPAGYNKPSVAVQLKILDGNHNGKPTNGDSEEYEDGYVALDVINTQGFQLPQTGGAGTMMFTAGGVVLMGAALILFFVRAKKKKLEK